MLTASPRRRGFETLCLLLASAYACAEPPRARDAASEESSGDLLAPTEPPAGEDGSDSSAASQGSTEPARGDLLEPAAAPTSGTPADTRDKAAISRVISDNRARVRACYEAALAQNPGIEGALTVSFVINPDGSVKSAEVNWSESDIHVPELDTCAADVVKSLKFPPSSRGLESKVNYPFDFKPPRSK